MADAALVDEEAQRKFFRLSSVSTITVRVAENESSRAHAAAEASLNHLSQQISQTPTDELAELLSRIQQLRAEADAIKAQGDRIEYRDVTMPQREAWDSWSTDERREYLAMLGVHVLIRHAHQRGAWDPWRVHVTLGGDDPDGQYPDGLAGALDD